MTIQTKASHPHEEIQSRLFPALGGGDRRELTRLVEEQLVVCERELEGIPLRAKERGADFAEAAQKPMQALLEIMARYQAWLGELQQGLKKMQEDDEDTWAVAEAYRTGQDLIPEFTEVLEAYSQFFASYGPYESPFVNSLARAVEGIYSEQAQPAAWDAYLVNFHESFEAKIKELEALLLPGKTSCIKSLNRATEILESLQDLEALEDEELGAAFERLDQALVESLKTERLMSEGTEGPTSIPATNVLIAVVQKGSAEELELTVVEGFYHDYCELMDNYWEGFEKSIGAPSRSALVQDEIPRTLEYADAHDTAVEELGVALAEGDESGVKAALDKVIAMVAKIDESREVYKLAAQHQSHLVCTDCGRANPPENKLCEACGVILPRPDEHPGAASSTFSVLSGPALEDSQQLQMTENVARLFQACDDVAVGKITTDEFQEELRIAGVGVKDFAEELDELAEDTLDEEGMDDEALQVWRQQHLPFIQEVAVAFTDGIQEVQAGLEEMARYLVEADDAHLVEGIRIVWQGMSAIHRARLSMNANLSILDDVLEEAREQGLLSEESQGS